MKKRELVEKVASKVGVLITVIVNEGKLNPTTYLQARVWLQLEKPLVRVVPITLKERMTFLVQYEKIPFSASTVVSWVMRSPNVAMVSMRETNVSGDIGLEFLFCQYWVEGRIVGMKEAGEEEEDKVEEGDRVLIPKRRSMRWKHRMKRRKTRMLVLILGRGRSQRLMAKE